MRGISLLLLLLLLIAMVHYSRWILPDQEELPALLFAPPRSVIVGVEFSAEPGRTVLHQLNSGSRIIDVINMTHPEKTSDQGGRSLDPRPIIHGELIKVVNSEEDSIRVERSWLPAHHRILLKIPLHPDRMTLTDWTALPGVGMKLAQTIEDDRQKNGEFGEFVALKRVKGIGSKKLEQWKDYFSGGNEQIGNK